MSTIVVVEKKDKRVIASDTLYRNGSTRAANIVGCSKVHRIGDSFIGAAGFAVYTNLLTEYLRTTEGVVLADEGSIFSFFIEFWKKLRSDYHMIDDACDDDVSTPFANLDAEFVIANSSGQFRVEGTLSTVKFDKFCAIGSGSPYAEGALSVLYDSSADAEEIAVRAIQVAMEYDCATGDEIEVHNVPPAAALV